MHRQVSHIIYILCIMEQVREIFSPANSSPGSINYVFIGSGFCTFNFCARITFRFKVLQVWGNETCLAGSERSGGEGLREATHKHTQIIKIDRWHRFSGVSHLIWIAEKYLSVSWSPALNTNLDSMSNLHYLNKWNDTVCYSLIHI